MLLATPGDLTQLTSAGMLNLYLNGIGDQSYTLRGGNGSVWGSLTACANIGVTYTFTPVPEPSVCGLLVLGLALIARRDNRAS